MFVPVVYTAGEGAMKKDRGYICALDCCTWIILSIEKKVILKGRGCMNQQEETTRALTGEISNQIKSSK